MNWLERYLLIRRARCVVRVGLNNVIYLNLLVIIECLSMNNNNKKSHKRKSNNNVSPSKRSKKNGRRVTFKNSVNVKKLDIEENAREYRKPVQVNKKNRNELPTYMTNHSVLKNKINRINHHKKTTLKAMKNT